MQEKRKVEMKEMARLLEERTTELEERTKELSEQKRDLEEQKAKFEVNSYISFLDCQCKKFA